MSKERELLMREAVRHQKVLTCFAYTLLKDWSLAEDAVQETLIAASTTELHTIRNMKGWLKRVTYNKSIDMLRKRHREVPHLDEELSSILEKQFNAFMKDDHLKEFEQKRKLLRICMNYLNKNIHDMVTHFYNGVSCEKLAAKYERSVNSIWLAISRARKSLRKCVKRQLDSGVVEE